MRIGSRNLAALAAIVVLVPAFRLAAQGVPPASAIAAFEVAAVRPNTSGETATRWVPELGRFTASNVTLRLLISSAFGQPQQPLADFQMAGGPPWLDTARFDVAATAPGATPVQMMPMLRRLLEERFQLRSHLETRTLPIYALVLARRDGVLGPNMRPTATDCDAVGKGPVAERCGGGQIVPGTLTATGASMPQIVNGLARLMPGVSRLVVDRTGLSGRFDIELTWTPSPVDLPPGERPGAPLPPIDPTGPSLFTALREQWGLRLDAETGPVPVLVIDSAMMPAEN